MADAYLLFPAGWALTDSSNDPVSSGVIKFFDTGTSNARKVYSDSALTTSLGTEIVTNSAGRPASGGNEVLCYASEGAIKLQALTSASASIWTYDDHVGALDTVGFTAASVALPKTPILTKTAAYTQVVGDQGKLINMNVSTNATLTLMSAVTAGDDFRVGIRNIHATGRITIATVSSQTIDGEVTQNLVNQFEGLWLVSNGTDWHIDSNMRPIPTDQVPVLTIRDRDATTAATGGDGGDRWIIAGTGGDWSTFATNDIAERDGAGSWFNYTPAEGWLAWLRDENAMVQFDGTNWKIASGMTLLDSGSAATDSDLNINFSTYDGFRGLVLEIFGARPSTELNDLMIQFATDTDGTTYATAGLYHYANNLVIGLTISHFATGGGLDPHAIQIARQQSVNTTRSCQATVKMMGHAQTGDFPTCNYESSYPFTTASGGNSLQGGGTLGLDTEGTMRKITGIRVFYSADMVVPDGTIDIDFALYGLA